MHAPLRTIVLAASLTILAGCAPPAEPGPRDDYAVYRDLIAQLGFKDGLTETGAADTVVIEAQTDPREVTGREDGAVLLDADVRARLRGAHDSAFQDFERRNGARVALDPGRLGGARVVLIDEQERDALFTGDMRGWDRFYERYPRAQGMLTLTLPGFSDDGTEAVIYYANQVHWCGGAGWLVLLRWSGTRWKIEERSMLWIS